MIEITPLGDAALTVRFAKSARKSPSDLLLDVLGAKRAIDRASIPGVLGTASSYSTLAIFLDLPALVGGSRHPENVFEQISAEIREVLGRLNLKSHSKARRGRIEIPVCFDTTFALDLADVANERGLTAEILIKKFCAADYQVACIGFMPGFPYLIGLPAELATPRRETPRVSVPAGSVAIGNHQAGIYPIESPGGWNIIGRTPLRMFDVNREDASLLSAGDRVRFRAISLDEFHEMRSRAVL